MKGIVFCDIDGCLSSGKNRQFDLTLLAKIRDVIPRLATKGIAFTLCTGRPQPYAEAMAQLLGSDLPLVCEGGAMVYEPVGDKYRPMANAENMRDLRALQSALQASDLLHDDLYFELGNAYSICVTGPVIAGRSHTEIRAEMDRMMALYAEYPVSWTHSTTSIDITPLGVNKGSGLRAICADHDIALAQTAGIGDSNGDLAMFEVAARGYCPNNASDELKSLASYISEQSYLAGALDILLEIESNPAFL